LSREYPVVVFGILKVSVEILFPVEVQFVDLDASPLDVPFLLSFVCHVVILVIVVDQHAVFVLAHVFDLVAFGEALVLLQIDYFFVPLVQHVVGLDPLHLADSVGPGGVQRFLFVEGVVASFVGALVVVVVDVRIGFVGQVAVFLAEIVAFILFVAVDALPGLEVTLCHIQLLPALFRPLVRDQHVGVVSAVVQGVVRQVRLLLLLQSIQVFLFRVDLTPAVVVPAVGHDLHAGLERGGLVSTQLCHLHLHRHTLAGFIRELPSKIVEFVDYESGVEVGCCLVQLIVLVFIECV